MIAKILLEMSKLFNLMFCVILNATLNSIAYENMCMEQLK